MGEYAIDRMVLDVKRMTGKDVDRSFFEVDERALKPKPYCVKCGKKFRIPQAAMDHLRDKHGIGGKYE